MKVTFTLSDIGIDSTLFNIVGNPGNYTTYSVTSSQLATGFEITYPDSVTGGTVTVVDDAGCVGYEKTWRVDNTLYPVTVYGANDINDSCNKVNGAYTTIYQYETSLNGLVNGREYFNIDGSKFVGIYTYFTSNRTCRKGYFQNGIFISMGLCSGCDDISEPPID